MIDISKLSKKYSARILEDSDVEMLVEICKQNIVFYEYTEARPTKENILDDMKVTPPGIDMQDKYYRLKTKGHRNVALFSWFSSPKTHILPEI